MRELFTLVYTFMDELFAFDATFMDELVSLQARTRSTIFKKIKPFFVFQVEIYATNAKKTRKKHEIFTHIY